MGRACCARRERRSRLGLFGLRRPAGPASSPSFPGFLSRQPRAAARPALAALLLVGAATVAAPAAADTLVSNTGQSADDEHDVTRNGSLYQGFTTGSNSGGYTLETVSAIVVATDEAGQTDDLVLKLCPARANGRPDTSATCTDLGTVAYGDLNAHNDGCGTVTVNPTDFDLAAETTYFVRFSTSGSDNGPMICTTLGNGQTGASGWSIANAFRWSTSGTPNEHEGHAIRIQVDGTAKSSSTNTAPTASNGTVETDEDRDYTFAHGDFNFSDTDSDDTELASVKIVSVETAGDLELDGYAGATVTIAPADADEENDGHQVALPVGESAIEVTVTPGDGSAAQTYTVAVTREAAVSGSGVLTGFVLVDALTDADLGAVADGATVTVSSAGLYGVRAETQTDAEVGSVALMLRGPGAHGAEHRQMESIAPYSLYGDAQGAEHGRALAAGSYTLTATAHAEPHGVGETLGTLTVSFTVAVEAPASSAGVLTGFTLVDVSDQSTVATLADGAEVDLGAGFAGSFGIRANVAPDAEVGSVALSLAGATAVSRTESIAPYSLWGDANRGSGSALHGAALAAGSYTLSATAYAKRRATRTVTMSVS